LVDLHDVDHTEVVMLSVVGAECRIFIVMLTVIKLSVSKLNVINAEYWIF